MPSYPSKASSGESQKRRINFLSITVLYSGGGERGVLGQSGFETSKCTQSGHFKVFLQPACCNAPAIKPGSISLCLVLLYPVHHGHCSPCWTLHAGKCFGRGQPLSLFRSGKPDSGIQAWNWHLPFVFQLQRSWKVILHNSLWAVIRKYHMPTALSPNVNEYIHSAVRTLSTEISSFISLTTASMLGLGK